MIEKHSSIPLWLNCDDDSGGGTTLHPTDGITNEKKNRNKRSNSSSSSDNMLGDTSKYQSQIIDSRIVPFNKLNTNKWLDTKR